MDKRTLLPCLLLTFGLAYNAIGQTNTTEVKIGEMDTLNHVLPVDYVYKFPRFTEGVVVFNNKKLGKGMLNYNYLTNSMQFVENPELTKVDANKISHTDIQNLIATDVKCIFIGKLTFIKKDKDFLLQITDLPTNLLKKEEVILQEEEKTGAYGLSVNTGSTTVTDNYYKVGGSCTNFAVSSEYKNEETKHYKKKTYFYLSNESRIIQIKNEKQFFKFFPQHNEEIKRFIEDKKTDFYKETSLIELVKFCNTLK